jgi:Heliorhodopsin
MPRPLIELPAGELTRLRRYNAGMGLLHLLQAIAVLLLANDFSLPVTAAYLSGPPGTVGEQVVLFDSWVAGWVAAFLLLSALAHAVLVLPGVVEVYGRGLASQRNYARWIEYSISSSVMMVLIAQLAGLTDIAALLGIFGVNATMCLFGLLQEKYEWPGSGGWLPFWFGCIAGIVPWVLIVLYAAGPGGDRTGSVPGFVIAIFISLFIFFNSFAINMALQYRQTGRWRDYLFGERMYVLLSLVAKSALAWQIFAGTLAG